MTATKNQPAKLVGRYGDFLLALRSDRVLFVGSPLTGSLHPRDLQEFIGRDLEILSTMAGQIRTVRVTGVSQNRETGDIHLTCRDCRGHAGHIRVVTR